MHLHPFPLLTDQSDLCRKTRAPPTQRAPPHSGPAPRVFQYTVRAPFGRRGCSGSLPGSSGLPLLSASTTPLADPLLVSGIPDPGEYLEISGPSWFSRGRHWDHPQRLRSYPPANLLACRWPLTLRPNALRRPRRAASRCEPRELGNPTPLLLYLILLGLVLLSSILLYPEPVGLVSATVLQRNLLSPWYFSLPRKLGILGVNEKPFSAFSFCPQTRPCASEASGKVEAYLAWAAAGRWQAPVSGRRGVGRGEPEWGGQRIDAISIHLFHVWDCHFSLLPFAESKDATLLE